jgi:hypothetical protein
VGLARDTAATGEAEEESGFIEMRVKKKNMAACDIRLKPKVCKLWPWMPFLFRQNMTTCLVLNDY